MIKEIQEISSLDEILLKYKDTDYTTNIQELKSTSTAKAFDLYEKRDRSYIFYSYNKNLHKYLIVGKGDVAWISEENFNKSCETSNYYIDILLNHNYYHNATIIIISLLFNTDEVKQDFTDIEKRITYFSRAITQNSSKYLLGLSCFNNRYKDIFKCRDIINSNFSLDGNQIFSEFCRTDDEISEIRKYNCDDSEYTIFGYGYNDDKNIGMLVYTNNISITKKFNNIMLSVKNYPLDVNSYAITKINITDKCTKDFIDRFFSNNKTIYNKVLSVNKNIENTTEHNMDYVYFEMSSTNSTMSIFNLRDVDLNKVSFSASMYSSIIACLSSSASSDIDTFKCRWSGTNIIFINLKYICEHNDIYKIDVTNSGLSISNKNKKITIKYYHCSILDILECIKKYDKELCTTLTCKYYLIKGDN